jgi:ankyrin repeat protein
LVKAGFPINEPVDDDSNTLLNFACQCGWTTGYNHYSFKGVVIDEALRHGADVNLSNHSGVTPLMNACNKYFDLMEKYQLAFLENGADVNAKDREGNTALHYAARNDDKNGAKTLCDMLLEFDADISAVNNAGKTALDIAVETNNEPLVKLLLNKIN